MSYEDAPVVPCSEPGCDATRKNHQWGAIKAHAAGWFEQKDGQSWCPEHTPPWVAAWREGRG